jgi:hypothetical protein
MPEKVVLDWRTANELDNRGFSVERSRDGNQWSELGFVAGNGTTDAAQRYRYVDIDPIQGRNYYRLKQLDFDGAYDYSTVVSADFGRQTSAGIRITPNPATGRVTVTLNGDWRDAGIRVELFTLTGKRVRSYTQRSSGANELPLDQLAAGMYLVRVSDGRQTVTERLVVRD